jgi:hypothetical protein
MDAEDPAGLLRRALRSIAIFSLRLDPPGALQRSQSGLWHRTRRLGYFGGALCGPAGHPWLVARRHAIGRGEALYFLVRRQRPGGKQSRAHGLPSGPRLVASFLGRG